LPGGGDNEHSDLGDRPPEHARIGDLGRVTKRVLATTLIVLLGTNQTDTVVEFAHRDLNSGQVLGFGEILIVGGVGAMGDVDGKGQRLSGAEPRCGVGGKTKAILAATRRGEGEARRFWKRAFVKIKLFGSVIFKLMPISEALST
jgi:hypothetical protein